MPTESLLQRLEALHHRWHRPELLGTDPLAVVHAANPGDREVVALLASSLAMGRASQIVRAAADLVGRIGTPVARRLAEREPGSWGPDLDGFVYRFFSAAKVGALLDVVGEVLRAHGTLEAAWASTGTRGWSAVEAFSRLLRSSGRDLGVLVPVEGSLGAAKRLNLFLRWMVRKDDLDLGLWSALSPADLFMPIDTHVLQWARAEGLTSRSGADRQACLEVTAALSTVCPEDPLRYDFAITRAGMAAKNTLNQGN